jgi:LAO/AO transport system kinase
MTDFFLLLLLPSGGDELRGIKRGVMELADLILVNKADGDLRNAASRTVAGYRQATGLLQPRTPGWEVPVQAVSALAQEGIVEVLTLIERCWQGMRENGALDLRRAEQARQWLRQELREGLLERFMADSGSQRQLARAEDDVAAARLPATVAARRLLTFFAGNSEKKT